MISPAQQRDWLQQLVSAQGVACNAKRNNDVFAGDQPLARSLALYQY
jgi:hypothetical protein